ncbi:MAG: periplasmic divalent cation tolerance protein [Acidobacteriota bacterium]|jgi:periplasmic divalent cation tolerance protein|nr:periplasmic divalent cation tolerance protein [Acidobacteriota bacterium]
MKIELPLLIHHSSFQLGGFVVTEANSAAIMVLMTAGSQEEASRLAEMLVGAHLAACVQIMPQMESIYRWKGEVHRTPEFLLLAKTTASCFDELEHEVRALHTYDTPEIIALPVAHVSMPYFEWLTSNAFPPLVSRQTASEKVMPPTQLEG